MLSSYESFVIGAPAENLEGYKEKMFFLPYICFHSTLLKCPFLSEVNSDKPSPPPHLSPPWPSEPSNMLQTLLVAYGDYLLPVSLL